MAKKETIQALWILIDSSLVPSASGKYFLPPSSLDVIFTEEAIERAVKELECDPEEKIGLAEKIRRTARKIFATLIRMQREESIVAFRNHGFVDENLPLSEEQACAASPAFGKAFAREFQWQFDPYVFPQDMADHHRDLQSEKILPFVKEQPMPTPGGFSCVSWMDIHPSMQQFYPNSNSKQETIQVVRKRLQRRQSEDAYNRLFTHERRCLRLLNRLRHPNIIRLIGSYTQAREHYFLFPRLEMDLAAFFKLDDPFGEFRWPATYYSALHGLASALCVAHNLHLDASQHGVDFDAIGYHHDLRPANILVSRETLVLADFGLSKLKSAGEVSTTAWKAGTGDYIAPECMDDEDANQDVGRSMDIWAFACLTAEVITFRSQGPRGLREFRELRLAESPDPSWINSYFYASDGDVRPSVRRWVHSLEARGEPKAVGKLLFRMWAKEPMSRPGMVEVRGYLAILSLQARYQSVHDRLTWILDSLGLQNEQFRLSAMNIWFEKERLRVFDLALGLTRSSDDNNVPLIAESLHDHCEGKLSALYKLLQFSPEFSDGQNYKMGGGREPELTLSDEYLTNELLSDIRALVQDLWDSLPDIQLRMVETEWVHGILAYRDVEQLEMIERGLALAAPRDIYQEGAALAAMRRIRLQILSAAVIADINNTVDPREIKPVGSFGRHELAFYKQTTPVLVEWMHYNPKWETVSSSQRAQIMSLKAKGFGVSPKPESLRLLDCIGFYERTEGDLGYGFVYKIPMHMENSAVPITGRATTLQQLILASAKRAIADPHCSQPLLEHRYALAYKLASFLAAFHTIEWLHENLAPHNIVFFPGDSLNFDAGIGPHNSSLLLQPYVVGLHKSRPAGNSWHTEGPTDELETLDYVHPRYLKERRFWRGADYYSLGLMLLEIGLWYPARLWSQKSKNKTLSPEELRDLWIKEYVPRLGPRMGSAYRNAVQVCLDGSLDGVGITGVTDESAQSTFDTFVQGVVSPLAELASQTK